MRRPDGSCRGIPWYRSCSRSALRRRKIFGCFPAEHAQLHRQISVLSQENNSRKVWVKRRPGYSLQNHKLSRTETWNGERLLTRGKAALIKRRVKAGAENKSCGEGKTGKGLISCLKCDWQYFFFSSAAEDTLQLSCSVSWVKALALGQSNKKLIATIKNTM